MKISLIGPVYPYRGGISHHTMALANSLQKAGHKVEIFSFKTQFPGWLYPGASDRDPSQNPLQVTASFILEPFSPWTWNKTIKEILRQAPDLVIITWWTTFWAIPFSYLAASLKKRGVRQFFLIHNVLPHEKRFFDRFLAKLALGQGQGFLIQSEREMQKLKTLVANSRPVLVCPLPNFNFFTQDRLNKKEARRILGIPGDAPLLLFFGVVRPYKGLTYLLEALSELSKKGMDARLAVAGEFWDDVRTYSGMIEKLGLQGCVLIDNRYIPNEKVSVYFSAADLFVAPYVDATQSASVKIALDFGLPMVVTDILMDDLLAGAGSLVQAVPAANSHALAEAIQKALGQPLEDAAGPNPEKAQDSWDSMVRSVEKLADLLASQQVPG